MWTPLHAAVFEENVDMVHLLLELGADTAANAKMYEYAGTPLEIARQAGREESVKALTKHLRLEGKKSTWHCDLHGCVYVL